jgi:hypothetical protein
MTARHTTIFDVHNVLAAFIAIFLTTAAANAATYTYDLTLRFNGDYVFQLVSTPSKYEDADWTQESCYRGSSCYPTDFRPNFPDSLFRHLEIGATTSASFARDQHRTTCQIAGVEMNCSLIGMSMSVLEFYSSSPD